MRIFASDTVKNMMGRLGVADDEPIENRLITRTLESAQSKIEGFNFDSRKNVLEYDDVLNHQRKTMYDRRRELLVGGIDIVATKLDEVVVGTFMQNEKGELVSASEALASTIAAKVTEFGRERFYTTVRQLMLQTIDTFWVEHLEVMEYTRSSVNLRAYGQRDPLVEYKKEGLRLFREMQEAINNQIRNVIPHVGGGIVVPEQVALKETHDQAQSITQGDGSNGQITATLVDTTEPKAKEPGRNDPCPCGSGKKYKKCHGAQK